MVDSIKSILRNGHFHHQNNNMILDYIDKAYYINLDYRTDRKEIFENLFFFCSFFYKSWQNSANVGDF